MEPVRNRNPNAIAGTRHVTRSSRRRTELMISACYVCKVIFQSLKSYKNVNGDRRFSSPGDFAPAGMMTLRTA
jgi:hypothetical protein